MRICVLNPFFYPYSGGTETVLLEVYKRLAKKHQVTVITSNNGRELKLDSVFGIDVIRLKTDFINVPKAPLPYLRMHGLVDAIRKSDSQIYHINNRFQYTLSEVGKMKNIGKLALTIHNALPQNIDFITDSAGLLYDTLVGRRMMEAADLLTGVSKSALLSTVPKKLIGKSHVVYNGVDYDAFKKRPKSDAHVRRIADSFDLDNFTILDVGRLVPQKGHSYLIMAVKRLLREFDMKLVLLGDGPYLQKLTGLVEKEGLSGNVCFAGKVDHQLTKYYYNASDMFSLQSTYEPASVALLEAMASELSCVVARAGGMPEMMKDSGLYSTPRSIDSIYNKIKEGVLMDKRKIRRMVKAGRKIIIAEHDWDRISKQYENLFYNLCKD